MRVAFTTLGCRLNQFETQAMGRRLAGESATSLVGWEDAADVYVINSCTVTARAEQKCRQLARGAKRRHPGGKVVVVGCYSQINGRPLLELPEIDGALGNEEKRRLGDYLPRLMGGERVLEAATFRKGMAMSTDEWIEDFAGHSRAMIKVQEGCNMRCSFCAIWSARGPSRSRPPRDLVDQCRRLADAGFEEIVLGGVHMGHYGRELSPRTDLASLLSMLLELVDEGVRFRLSSIDPSEVDQGLARLLVDEPRLCRYLHLPLQSGSNPVLRAMRRPYGVEYYRALIEQIAGLDPGFGLGIDLIVGFPGETEADHESTLTLLESLPISFYHVFPYSDRPGTAASSMGSKVDGKTAGRRSRELRELGARKRERFLRAHVGGTYEGVVEGPGRPEIATDPEPVVGGERALLAPKIARDEAEPRELMLDDYATAWADVSGERQRKRVVIRVDSMDEHGRLRATLVESNSPVTGPRAIEELG